MTFIEGSFMVIVVHINHVNHNLIKDRVRLVVMVSYTLSIVLICTMVTNYLYHKLIEGRAWLVAMMLLTWGFNYPMCMMVT